MSASIYSIENGTKMVYLMGNRKAVVTVKGGEIRYFVRKNMNSDWTFAKSGPHVNAHINAVKDAIK